MKKVLVAVDGSGAARRALHAAMDLVRDNPDGSLHLYGEIAVYVPQASTLRKRSSRTPACRTRGKCWRARSAAPSPTMRTAIGNLLMGSAAQKVLHASRLPVLLVR